MTILLVAHGQPSAPDEGETRLETLRAAVAAEAPELELRGATLAAEGVFEARLEGVTHIYPCFMADGYFTKRVLPKRRDAAGSDAEILPPLGMRPDVLAYAARFAKDGAIAAGLKERETHLLLAAHGSGSGDAARKAAEDAMAQIRTHTHFAEMSLGFIEEEPFLDAAARATAGRPRLCLPLFAFEGGHMLEDVPELLEQGGFNGPVLPAIGLAPQIPALIAAQLREAVSAPAPAR
ncbi:CbiX/SirB N-terminal domain-containing protein [Paracoccaceae bacterium GXU_MW_L88]